MENIPATSEEPNGERSLHTDTLADSVLILIALMGVQRLVGFCRAVLFCRWLDPVELGQWDMAFSFLMLAGPLSVLALSSSLGRYVEHYRQRRKLRTLLKRTALACAALAASSALFVFAVRQWFSELVFGTPERTDLVGLLAGSLLAVIAFNYFYDLFAALRNIRLVALLQLLNGLVFAGLGVGLLLGWRCNAQSVILAYGGACAVSAAVGIWWLLRSWRILPEDGQPPPHRDLWSKLIPYATWILITSVLVNLFGVVDRYMILHYSSLSASKALVLVGQYHSSRVVPLLLVSVAAILGSMITPHLSHDWEAGRRDRVTARLNLLLKLFGFVLAAAGVMVLFVSPLLFGVAFQGKFAGGLAVLPWTLVYCTWFAMYAIIQNYLLCCEKARLASLAFLIGLAANVGLNLLLLPRLGLLGAVLATTAANLAVVLLVSAFNHLLGFRMDRGAWLVLALPLLIPLGPWVGLAFLLAIVLETFVSDRFLSREEKQQLAEGWRQYRARFRYRPLALKSAGESP